MRRARERAVAVDRSSAAGAVAAADVVIAGVQGVVVHGSSLVFGVPAVNSDDTFTGYIASLRF